MEYGRAAVLERIATTAEDGRQVADEVDSGRAAIRAHADQAHVVETYADDVRFIETCADDVHFIDALHVPLASDARDADDPRDAH